MFRLPMRPVDDEFAATRKPTDPLPLPLAGVVSVIHGTLLLALHGQLAVIVTEPDPPAAGIDVDVGWRDTVQGAGGGGGGAELPPASCVMVTVSPPTVIVPVRAAPVLSATVKPTVPLPAPETGERAIQLTVLDAVHPHPAGPDTVTEPVPAAAEK
jgi:hypothetical protein